MAAACFHLWRRPSSYFSCGRRHTSRNWRTTDASKIVLEILERECCIHQQFSPDQYLPSVRPLETGRNNIPSENGGKKYTTTVNTLTQREPDSMLAAMFSGRHTVSHDLETGDVFVDRDGKHFRHILNWLRDGAIPTLSESDYQELLREAEYYQLLGLIEHINANYNKKKDDDDISKAEMTRADIIRCIQSKRVKLRGVNLSGVDLSKLDLSYVDFSFASIHNTFFSRANLHCSKFRDAEADGSIFHNANLRECEFTGAKLRGGLLAGANLQSANLQDACLVECSFYGADLRSAHLQAADLTNANLEGANLEGANLKGAKLTGANLQGANLQRAYLRHVDLRETQLEGAKLGGANLLGAIR